MQNKLTITINEKVYEAYAEMAKDESREKEAGEWTDIIFKDIDNETV